MDGPAADALLAHLRGRTPLFLMHVNADPDCVGSAHALREAFGGTVAAPAGVSKTGSRLARRLGLEVDEWPHPENFGVVVAVDTSSRSQLGRMGERVPRPLLVDHHRYGDLQDEAPAKAWDPARASCAEVVLALLDRAGRAPSPEAAFGLLCGLVTDTARFRFADPAALQAAARLVALSGATLESVYAFLDTDPDQEEDAPTLDARRAVLTAITRANVSLVGTHLVATSEIGAHDAAAAGALVRAGADLAIVGNEKGRLARLSLRASERLRGEGLHLGEMANAVAREVEWSGGGHEGAAGLSGPPPLEKARSRLLLHVRKRLEGR